jgi:hypothetical protein
MCKKLQDQCRQLRQEMVHLKGGKDSVRAEDFDLMDEQVTQQLQQLLSDKAQLQQDKIALQQENDHLLQLLEYASASLEER